MREAGRRLKKKQRVAVDGKKEPRRRTSPGMK